MRRTITVAILAAVVGALVATPLAVHASHSFTDVSDSNTFHEDIAWLADAGVTKGCNPPTNSKYCPKDNVTREQMAAFMRRLAMNRVVDAGSLEGSSLSDVLSAGIQGYQIATSSQELGLGTTAGGGSLTASCPGDLKVIGGGASAMQPNGLVSSGYQILQDFPGDDESSWKAFYSVSKSSGVIVEVKVYAICAVA